MKWDVILSRNWCDMVFEHRNQEYGAYVMRSETGRRYGIALGVLGGLIILLLVPFFIMVILNGQPSNVVPKLKLAHMEGIRLREAYVQKQPEKKVIETSASKQESTQIQNSTEDGKDELNAHLKEKVKFDENLLEELTPETTELEELEATLELAQGEERTSGVIVDTIPHFPMGIAAFMKWLDHTVIYPPECIRKRQEGTVVLAFIVENDGRISDPRILQSAGKALDHEALRVVELMPHWKPARRSGKAIRAQVTVPIVFEMSD